MHEVIGCALRTVRLHGLVHVALVVLRDGPLDEGLIVLRLVGVARGYAAPAGGGEGEVVRFSATVISVGNRDK